MYYIYTHLVCNTKLYQTLAAEFEHRRFVWELRREIERPRVVNAKLVPVNTKDNYFAQVVVRLNSTQVSVM